MEQLHFVGFTNDSEALMLSHREDATAGEYFVEIDDYLLAAIEQFDGEEGEEPEDVSQPEPLPLPRPSVVRTHPKPASELSPREIQARLRSGSSVADVAEEAGVEEEWVLRFADPILAEQARVVEQAQRLTFTKPRVGPSAQPLRTSVRWNLADQGALRDAEVFDAGWSAYNLHGSRWVVRLSFVAKRRRKLAEWEVDLREGELTARNRVATDLGYVEPGRRRRPPADDSPVPLPPARAGRPGVKRATKAARTAKKRPVAKRSTSGRAGGSRSRPSPGKAPQKSVRRQPSKRTAARKTGARTTKASAARPVKRTPAKKVAKRSPAKKTAAKKSAGRKAATRRSPGKRASSKAPPARVIELERPSHMARPMSPVAKANRIVDQAAYARGRPYSTGGAAPVPGSAVAQRPAAERVPVQAQDPARSSRDVPSPQRPQRKSPRPTLVIMSTPETHGAEGGVAASPVAGAGDEPEGSRWPLPRRRR